jgi:hypothetical protein
MDDLVEFDGRKNLRHGGGIGEVAVEKFKGQGEGLDIAEIRALELWIVKVVQVVKRPDAMAVAQESFANVRTDETRAAGDEKVHDATLTIGAGSVEDAGKIHERVINALSAP